MFGAGKTATHDERVRWVKRGGIADNLNLMEHNCCSGGRGSYILVLVIWSVGSHNVAEILSLAHQWMRTFGNPDQVVDEADISEGFQTSSASDECGDE